MWSTALSRGKTAHRSGNVLKREDRYNTTHAFVSPSWCLLDVWSNAWRQTDQHFHINVVCGALAIGENQHFFSSFFWQRRFLVFFPTASTRLFPFYGKYPKSILIIAHLERMDFLFMCFRSIWFQSVLVKFGSVHVHWDTSFEQHIYSSVTFVLHESFLQL